MAVLTASDMSQAREQAIAAAAAALQKAWVSGQPCAPVRHLLPADDVAVAYAVQEVRTARLVAEGRRVIGRKIGLTSRVVQRQLGVDQPDYGMLFDDMDAPLGAPIDYRRLHQPKVEAEVAFILGRDLDDARLTSADVLAAVDYAVAAIEIVGSRIQQWDIKLVDTIADNASSGMFVLGHELRRLTQCDVVNATMRMTRGADVVSTGNGAACMGSPLSAVLWLAKTAASLGKPLRSGDVVLAGALGPMVGVKPGDEFEARIDGLGSVKATFGLEESGDA
ncbi:fumarylacetoacetate hydrolase family protein [Steroidobacter sp. S1-65]|uniref:Fumarylacetoacetate hydrolase family protein n=1 Tax=Steroidobacter gossypii TaxID=2805490 RepID=A0ABS1WVB6_9GAMM|nr:fumarylacetoacetate hydrolase family protein [Steroidobacter gossypii]MBM0104921.1 fumarylacetoacetate hydrolase family protein [Steroidobacter gossypii]